MPSSFIGSRRALLGGRAAQAYSEKVALIAPANLIGWWKQAESYSPVAGTGTIAQTLTAILGVGTVFLSQLQIGDLLIGTGISGYVTAIADDTHLTLSSSATVGASSFTYTRQISIDSSSQLNNGLYRNVTLGQSGIGDELAAASYNGTTSVDNVYSAALNTDFGNGQRGTLAGWAKVSGAGIWTDGLFHSIATFSVNGSNELTLIKVDTNNTLRAVYVAGATAKIVNSSAVGGALVYFHVAVTFDKVADELKFYINGAQVGATQTGLGTWAGSLASTLCVVGANTSAPASVWSGFLEHVMLWAGAGGVLSALQVLALATVP